MPKPKKKTEEERIFEGIATASLAIHRYAKATVTVPEEYDMIIDQMRDWFDKLESLMMEI